MQFESCEDEDIQEQELKTLSSYYLDLRQVYSLIILCPNNIYFMLTCIKSMGTYHIYCLSMSLNSRVTFIKIFWVVCLVAEQWLCVIYNNDI